METFPDPLLVFGGHQIQERSLLELLPGITHEVDTGQIGFQALPFGPEDKKGFL